MEDIKLNELDIDSIRPSKNSSNEMGGYKILVLGAPGSGKSHLIKALLYSKRNLIPAGVVVSGTENFTSFYSKIFPSKFIYTMNVDTGFDEKIIKKIKNRQSLATKQKIANPWAILILDDCMADPAVFSKNTSISDLIKNSRHWSLLTVFVNQYPLDFEPKTRALIDGVFIFRTPSTDTRQKIHSNFASIIPKDIFNFLMDEVTQNYTAIFIDKQKSTNNWQECVYYYKAPEVPDFKFGHESFWSYGEEVKE